MIALSLICCVAAFALLGLATDEHHLKRLGGRPSAERRRRMQGAAWAALTLSFPLSVAAKGWIFGPVVWSGAVMTGAGIVFLWLHFAPGSKAAGRR